MKTIYVDDEHLAIARFRKITQEIPGIELVGTFLSAEEAINFARDNAIDLAILDIEINGFNGIDLGKTLKVFEPDLQIIYISGFEEYAIQSYQLKVASYLLKPYTFDDLKYAVDTATILSHRKRTPLITIHTFGLFDIFVNGAPVLFSQSKAKELLALLVDSNGASISSSYAITYLWEDKPFDEKTQSLFYKCCKNMLSVLKEHQIDHIVTKTRNQIYLNKKHVDCDYFRFLDRDPDVSFCGEYMQQYSWAENTLAKLEYLAK